MIRTVEVINLLNMIRNDEETPNLIIWKGKAYKRQWGDYMGDLPIDEYYVNEDGDSWFVGLDLALDSEIQTVYTVNGMNVYEEIEELNCNEYDYVRQSINSLIRNQRKLIDEIAKLNKECLLPEEE